MKIKKTALSFPIALLAVLALAMPASADTLNLVLSNPVQTGIPDSTLTFDATASAPNTNSATVFLVGDNFNVTLDGATIDDSDFLTFPFSLDPGDSSSGPLFTVALPSTIAPGTYTGFFEILGGSDPTLQDTIATVNFEIDAPAEVPEPGTWLLLATGLALLAALLYNRSIADARFIPQQ
jgi:PEP-CTERM motif